MPRRPLANRSRIDARDIDGPSREAMGGASKSKAFGVASAKEVMTRADLDVEL